MQLGAVTASLGHLSLPEMAKYLSHLGLRHVEFGAGGYFPKTHCNPEQLLRSTTDRQQFEASLAEAGLSISALAIHGEPLHPDPSIAFAYRKDFREACELASQLGISRLTLLAGLPEAAEGERYPNWIIFPFPTRNLDILNYQWERRLIPYWQEQAKIAGDFGVRLCFEMVPCDLVHQPAALLRLREAIGPVVGCNFDPSHLFHQGIDTLQAIMELGEAIYHVHAKDARETEREKGWRGLLDPQPISAIRSRSWIYRTVGYGHGLEYWRAFVSNLRQIGYDDVISIEHEDLLMDPAEGFESAIEFLKNVLFYRPLPDPAFHLRIGAGERDNH